MLRRCFAGTIQAHNLRSTASQVPQSELLIRAKGVGTRFDPLSRILPSHRTDQINDAALRFPLLAGNRLRVRLESDPAGCMAEQFLHHLYVRSVGSQQSRVGVPERVPSEGPIKPTTSARSRITFRMMDWPQ